MTVKKLRVLLTVVIITVLTVCMGCMVFGYGRQRDFMAGKTVTPGKVHLAGDVIDPKLTKRCAFELRYNSINTAGSYTALLYKKTNGTRTLYDSNNKTVKANSSSGIYAHTFYVYKNEEYEPGIRSTTSTINLSVLRAHFD